LPNTFIQNLATICREHLLAEKWLLAPNRRVGNQWVEQVARTGQPAVNLRVTTFRSLVLELSGADAGKLLSDRGVEILMSRVLHELRAQGPRYFTTLEVYPALVKALAKTLGELRSAGVTPAELETEKNQNLKMEELADLLADYEEGLTAGGYVDHSGLLADVAGKIETGAISWPDDRFLLVPDDTGLGRPEERVLDLLPAVTVKGLLPVCPPEKEPLTDLGRMAWLGSPGDAPPPFNDGSLQILGASGEVNEVRAALRRCLAEGWPFDQVEILYTDRDTYLPLLFETLARYSGVETGDLDALPASFSEGIPVRYSRPGRALTAWALWILEGFPVAALAGMVREGLLFMDGGGGLAERGVAADTLRQIAPGTARDLGAIIDALVGRRREAEKGDEAPEVKLDVSAIASLESVLKTLNRTIPGPNDSLPNVLDCALRFLVEGVRTAGELDEYARTALLKDIADAGRRMEELAHVPAGEPLSWLLSLAGEVRVAGSAPRAGKVHIAPLSAGGHSGRPHVIVLGLDDSRHPGSDRPEPVLLDREREEISGLLRLAGEDLGRREESLAALAARTDSVHGKIPATLTLACSLQDLVRDRDTFPGAALVRAYRILKDPLADQDSLLAHLSPPGGFIDPGAGACLDSAEWWIDRFTVPLSIPDARPAFMGRFAHLKQGQEARDRRSGMAPSSWEGLVGSLPPELDMMSEKGPAVSANRLQTLGRCSLRYFFSYLLEITRVDEEQPEPDRWLSPLDRGTILHDLFHEYMDRLIKTGDAPDADRDGPELLWALEKLLSRHEAAAPPSSHQVRDHEASQLADSVRIFLTEEELFTADHEPLYAEASLGMASTVLPTELDCPEPIPVTLSSGRVIRVRGRVDRIDRRRGDGQFVITDYKSGSKTPFTGKDRFGEGRIVQHLLYLLMVEARLIQTLALAPPVAAFRFLFPTSRDQGESVVLSREELEERMDILEDLCHLAESGCFAPTDTADDCTWCDYTLICGDTGAQARRVAVKLQEGDDPRLDPMRRLRGYL
jgi:ATP-dependent helicase/nuclease subunit B